MAERFAFFDPFDKRAINRVTRYRAKKRRIAEEATITPATTYEPTPHEIDLSTDSYVGDDARTDHAVSPDRLTFGDGDEDDSLHQGDDSCIAESSEPSPNLSHDSHNQVPVIDPDDETVGRSLSLDNPVYDGSSLSVAASNVLIMKLKMRHSLSNECVQDLLSLIKLHCPTPNNCVTSLYKFNKKFGKSDTVLHYHCNVCYQSINEDDLVCTNSLCKNNVVSGGRSSFIEVPIEQQLRTILERK